MLSGWTNGPCTATWARSLFVVGVRSSLPGWSRAPASICKTTLAGTFLGYFVVVDDRAQEATNRNWFHGCFHLRDHSCSAIRSPSFSALSWDATASLDWI